MVSVFLLADGVLILAVLFPVCISHIYKNLIVGGSRISQREVPNPSVWQDICRKLHENERIWSRGGVND